MTTIAVQNGTGQDLQCVLYSLDGDGQILYQTPPWTLLGVSSPYDWLFYVDGGLDGWTSLAIALASSQGQGGWDAWSLPPIGSMTSLLGDVDGAVSIGVGPSTYTPQYSGQLPDGRPLVTSVWSPSGGQQAQYVYGSNYLPLGSTEYPSADGLLGICTRSGTQPTTPLPACCLAASKDDSSVVSIPPSQLCTRSTIYTSYVSLVEVTDTPPDDGGAGEGTGTAGGTLSAAERGTYVASKIIKSDPTGWWWVFGVVVIVIILALGTGYLYWRRQRHNRA